jgi:hypothetical protein
MKCDEMEIFRCRCKCRRLRGCIGESKAVRLESLSLDGSLDQLRGY